MLMQRNEKSTISTTKTIVLVRNGFLIIVSSTSIYILSRKGLFSEKVSVSSIFIYWLQQNYHKQSFGLSIKGLRNRLLSLKLRIKFKQIA
ncbi:MAG: hypothetical protein CSA22_01390 [Deltaproteobacteria bacterium]|nr:MAG: hypothetical protein CSA22_01390 [Deltaproteobacteria bacterium]